MKKLRELMAIMAIMATAVAMTGCGNDDDDDDDDGPPAATAPASLSGAVPYNFTSGGTTRSITFTPSGSGASGNYTVSEGTNATEAGTYTYSTNNANTATLTLTPSNNTNATTVTLTFSTQNNGSYRAVTPGEQDEVGTFNKTTTPVDTTPVDTTPVDTTPVDTTPVDTNQSIQVVGRRIQIQYGQAAGSPGELFTFNQGGTFASDFEPGAGGTYTATTSGNTATVNLTYTTPAHANGDTATFNLTQTSATGGSFTGTTVYGGSSSSVSGPWSYAP